MIKGGSLDRRHVILRATAFIPSDLSYAPDDNDERSKPTTVVKRIPMQMIITPTAVRPNLGGQFASPLRYPGGKGRLGPWLAEVISHNRLNGGWYVEPYAGGAGAAIYLLLRNLVDHVVINDLDPLIHAFWTSATKHSQKLIRLIRETPITMESRERLQLVIQNPSQHDVIEVGFATFFLNRTNRSGILAGGVIGGKAQAGPYKLDARFARDNLIQRITEIGDHCSKITILGMDAVDLLTYAGPGFPAKSLVYLDPPYYLKGSLLYRNHYKPEDHAAIAKIVQNAVYPTIVTYDNCWEVRDLYQGTKYAEFSLHYSTHSARPKATEALFYRNLDLPIAPIVTRKHRLSLLQSGSASDFK